MNYGDMQMVAEFVRCHDGIQEVREKAEPQTVFPNIEETMRRMNGWQWGGKEKVLK